MDNESSLNVGQSSMMILGQNSRALEQPEIRKVTETRISLAKIDYRAVASESKEIMKLSVPVMAFHILSFINDMLPLLTLGH